MFAEPNISSTAAMLADPTRLQMLIALMDGRALPAGELACCAGISAQTASAHLRKLVDSGFLGVETEGRHRYYRIVGGHVVEAIEHLSAIRPPGPVKRKAQSPRARELQFARRCYDHLAGRLGVVVTRRLQERGFLVEAPGKRFDVTAAGMAWFADLGLDVRTVKPTPRGLARPCLDWTERFHHLGGPLGVRFLEVLCEKDWLRRQRGSRAVCLTPRGRHELLRRLHIDDALLRGA